MGKVKAHSEKHFFVYFILLFIHYLASYICISYFYFSFSTYKYWNRGKIRKKIRTLSTFHSQSHISVAVQSISLSLSALSNRSPSLFLFLWRKVCICNPKRFNLEFQNVIMFVSRPSKTFRYSFNPPFFETTSTSSTPNLFSASTILLLLLLKTSSNTCITSWSQISMRILLYKKTLEVNKRDANSLALFFS